MKIKGILPALVTPYDAAGRVDTDKLQKLTEHLQKVGVDGFYVGGSTGESYLLSMDERKRVLEAVREVIGQDKVLIANIGMIATEQSIELAKHAMAIGADAVSSVPPFYFPFTTEEYIVYYNDLTDAVDLPVLLYNIPAMSGVNFSMDDLEALLRNPKIMGLKHTSYDLFQLQMLIQNHPEKTMFIGHDELFLSAIAIGAQAGIGSTFNIMPEKFKEMIHLKETGDMEGALRVQGDVNAVVRVLCKVGVFKGIKEILRMQGFDCGSCRKPFLPLGEEEKKILHDTAEKYGLVS